VKAQTADLCLRTGGCGCVLSTARGEVSCWTHVKTARGYQAINQTYPMTPQDKKSEGVHTNMKV